MNKESKATQKGRTDMEENKPHVRRKRYSGTHPKKFEEKYKELNPEKYADTIEHVISKGITPAGMHISICVNEILDFLQIKPGQKGLDATFGYGGHTRKMLEKLEGEGHMYALDIDPIEIKKTTGRLRDAGYGEDILTVKQMNFADIDKLVPESGLFDFVLADLGVSSMQIDNPERGFSYKVDGSLDLRLNPEAGVPAAERLAELDEDEIVGMLVENSDEPYAEQIAAQIMRERKRKHAIDTTTALRQVIEKALEFLPEAERREMVKKSCQRTFQALRIDVNSEFEVLDAFLSKLPGILLPRMEHIRPPRISIRHIRVKISECIYKTAVKKLCHLSPLLIGKARILAVALRVLKVNLLVGHIQIPAEYHRLVFLQFLKVCQEIVLPLHPVIQPSQAVL